MQLFIDQSRDLKCSAEEKRTSLIIETCRLHCVHDHRYLVVRDDDHDDDGGVSFPSLVRSLARLFLPFVLVYDRLSSSPSVCRPRKRRTRRKNLTRKINAPATLLWNNLLIELGRACIRPSTSHHWTIFFLFSRSSELLRHKPSCHSHCRRQQRSIDTDS